MALKLSVRQLIIVRQNTLQMNTMQQLDDVCSKEFKYGETDKDTETSQDD